MRLLVPRVRFDGVKDSFVCNFLGLLAGPLVSMSVLPASAASAAFGAEPNCLGDEQRLEMTWLMPGAADLDSLRAMRSDMVVSPDTLQTFTDPRSGAQMLVLWEGRTVWQRDVGTRVELLNLLLKTPPQEATTVQVWTSKRISEAVGIHVSPATVREYPQMTFDDHSAAIRAGRTPHTRFRAMVSYFDAAEYVRWVAASDDAGEWSTGPIGGRGAGDERADEQVEVFTSDGAMLRATFEPGRTVLMSMSLGAADGVWDHVAWFDHGSVGGPSDAGPQVLLPREERQWFGRAAKAIDKELRNQTPDRLLILRPVVRSVPSPGEFTWESFGIAALDARRSEHFADEAALAASLAMDVPAQSARSDEMGAAILAAALSERSGERVTKGGEAGSGEGKGASVAPAVATPAYGTRRGSRLSYGFVAVGIALIGLGGAMWWRRRA